MKAGTAEKKAARAMGKYRKRGFLLAFLAPCTILFLIVYAYPLVTIFLTSFCKWNYENFTAPKVNVTPQKAYLEFDSTLISEPGQIRLQSSVTMPRAGL